MAQPTPTPQKHAVDPALLVIFGATGDLAKRKLLPALFTMFLQGDFAPSTTILGIGRGTESTDESFREEARDALKKYSGKNPKKIDEWCDKVLFYQPIGEATQADYEALTKRITELEASQKLTGNRVYYLALPPSAFPTTIEALGTYGLNKTNGWTRIVVEKPFGHDLASAESLNEVLHKYFDESQVYRIDHYLGKETVQNLLAFRFANTIFESVWNRDKIERVEISVTEELGVETRAAYYEGAGALRDMIQNHISQLLALTTMEPPGAFEAGAIRYEKIKALKSIAPIDPENVVRGQYGSGEVEGEGVQAYRKEQGVDPNSQTETFAAVKLFVENWRWHGVPFILKTGKRLRDHRSEIVVTFRTPPVSIFGARDLCNLSPNRIIIALQPNEGFKVSFEVKRPGPDIVLHTEVMRFSYAEAFGPLPEAYLTLLLDVLQGDQTLFVSAEETITSWKLFDPVIKQPHAVVPYPSGSSGPREAKDLVGEE